MIWQVTFWARIKFSLVPGFRDLLTFAHLVWILICILIIWVNRVLKYEHFQGYFVVLWLILPEIQWFLFHIPLNLGSKRASMSVAYVIFSVIAGLPKVYPNFLDVSHSVLQQYEEKLRAPLTHTETPSAKGLSQRRFFWQKDQRLILSRICTIPGTITCQLVHQQLAHATLNAWHGIRWHRKGDGISNCVCFIWSIWTDDQQLWCRLFTWM